MGSSVSKYHHNQAQAIIHDELLPFTLGLRAVKFPVRADERANPVWWLKSCVPVMVFLILTDSRDMHIVVASSSWQLHEWINYLNLVLNWYYDMKWRCNPDIVAIFNTVSFSDHHNARFPQICWAATISERPLEKMCTHTSQLNIWERLLVHFLFPSVSQSERFISATVLSVFQADGEIQVWDYLWLLTRTHLRQLAGPALSLSSCFRAPYTTKSHTLLSRAYLCLNAVLVSYAWGSKLKADSGEFISCLH